MNTKLLLAKLFALLGTLLTLGPIALMLVTGVIGSIQSGQLRVDFLMVAELGIFVIAGALLLLAASLLAKAYIKHIGWTIAAAILVIFGGQAFAMLSGLASGRVVPEQARGWMAVVIGMIILFNLLVATLGVLGVRLLKKLFTTPPLV
jgi:hypothetical protein